MDLIVNFILLSQWYSNQKKLSDCLKDSNKTCKTSNTLSIDTSVNAGSFLCSEGRQGFVENFQCVIINFVENQEAIMPCYKFILQLIKNQDNKTGSEVSGETCGITEKITTCMEDKTKELCDEKTVPFIRSYVQASIKPLMKGIKCDNGQTTIKQQWTSLMIFVTFTICLYNILYA
ncbi:uncharacterized protein LOC134242403 [Saccostrea cucullata]|uniref:uncharacterized protein LOC134242403 n=1 Tax=Saccostrea cuccullata TaxID=36930 RepID=UPI002ED50C8F